MTTKEKLFVVIAYLVFFGLFWFLGKPHEMNEVTAYFGVVLLHVVFVLGAAAVFAILKK